MMMCVWGGNTKPLSIHEHTFKINACPQVLGFARYRKSQKEGSDQH